MIFRMKKVMACFLSGALLLTLQSADAQKTKPAQKAPVPQQEGTKIIELPPPEGLPFDTAAPPEDAMTADIRRLLIMSGSLENDVKQGEAALRESLKNYEGNEQMERFVQLFIRELKEGRARRWLTNLYLRAYRETFTHDELKALIAFYETPVGKGIMSKIPRLSSTVLLESQKIGSYLGPILVQEVEKEKNNP